ncbi:hypothetical protein PYCCODRAFT_1477236 [Trametes coccinea BRFM310]|uniref:Uncharacterized protein n=1 Tax=Trametes coccinea (strain BRFM310) TaxID=1353009 RepID=A0A1Y2IP82_TRAC3|nr:hypothetical protein PYCCODRAFT_1477236 [Trametes coccinea BRFM310]
MSIGNTGQEDSSATILVDLPGVSKMVQELHVGDSSQPESVLRREAELPTSAITQQQAVNKLPIEIISGILQEAWLDVPLFDALGRWELFSRLSLVNRTFREMILWIAIRQVRVLGHCSTDVRAYRSIGHQYLALHPPVPLSEAEALSLLFKHSTVHLDFTYATYWVCRERDRWLKDDITPGRPDDVHGIIFDLFAGTFGESTYPFPERREPEYLDWLSRRRRDKLSGWFADLLGAVPDCAAVVVEADEKIEPFTAAAYATLLESLWWWPALRSVHLLVVPGPPSFYAEMTGKTGGPCPLFPALPAVQRVRLSRFPSCTCKPIFLGTAHQAQCIVSRMLLPFPGLQTLRVDTRPDHPEDVFVPPVEGRRVEVSLGPQAEDKAFWYVDEAALGTRVADADMGPFLGRTPPPLWVPSLKISMSDALWETVDPENVRHGRFSFGQEALGIFIPFLHDP